MQGLQGAREPGEERDAGEGIGEGVDGGEEEVEAQSPVGQDGEVGEFGTGLLAAAEGLVRAAPRECKYRGDEGVQTLDKAGLTTLGCPLHLPDWMKNDASSAQRINCH